MGSVPNFGRAPWGCSLQRFDSVFDALGTVEGPMTEAEEREQVEPVIPPVAKHGHAQEKSFAAATADASGMTKQAINRHLARAEALGDDLDKVTGTSLDKGRWSAVACCGCLRAFLRLSCGLRVLPFAET